MKAILLLIGLILITGQPGHAASITDKYDALSKKFYFSQKPRKARIPPLPDGQIRIKAPLISLFARMGMHYYGGKSNAEATYCAWTDSKFGIVGKYEGDEGNLWFFADINAKTGKIEKVYVYGIGICGSPPCETAFLLSKTASGSFGDIGANGFTIKASGTGIGAWNREPLEALCRDDAGIIITGDKNLLEAKDGAKIPIKFYLGYWGRGLKAGRKIRNRDQGFGTAIIERNDAPVQK